MSDGDSGYCSSCGKPTPKTAQFCSNCGAANPLFKNTTNQTVVNTQTPYSPYKNPTTAVLIAAIGGVFGLSGIGHMYVGKIVKGIVILVVGIILFGVGVATLVFVVGFGFLTAYFVLWIWQIFDVRKLANQFNESLLNSGKQPW